MGLFFPFTSSDKSTMAKNKNAGKPRNYALECGVYRFGRSKMYHKKAIYKFKGKKAAEKASTAGPTFVEKPVKGAKNGETRMVRVKRLRNDVPTQEKAPAGTFLFSLSLLLHILSISFLVALGILIAIFLFLAL